MRRTWRIRKSCGEEEKDSFNFLRAGPRKNLYWDHSKVKADIVTCGDLLPIPIPK